MSTYQLVALGIRLFAIWLGLYFARATPAYYIEIQKFDDPIASAIIIVVAIVVLLVVLLLWFFPLTVARRLLPSPTVASSEVAAPDTWFAVGCGLLGLWLLAEMFPRLLQYIFVWYYARRNGMNAGQDFPSSAVYYVAEAVIGVWLLLGAKRARKIFWWARNTGAR